MTGVALSKEERAFFAELGERIGKLRNEARLTQAAAADHLGMSQQTIDAYEKGRSRVPVFAIVRLAKLFNVSIADIIEGEQKKRRGPDSKFETKIAKLRTLPRSQQKVVLAMIDGVIEAAQ